MAIDTDMIKAVGATLENRAQFSDAEIGWQMKCAARQAIDDGEIKTEEDAVERFKIRARWIAEQTEVSETVRAYWIKFEQKFFFSARKYLAEIREMENVSK